MLFRVTVYEQTPPEAIENWSIEVIRPIIFYQEVPADAVSQDLTFTELDVNISELPSSDSPITSIEYKVNSGNWIQSPGQMFTIDLGVPMSNFTVSVRCVNSVGLTSLETTKQVTLEKDPVSGEEYSISSPTSYFDITHPAAAIEHGMPNTFRGLYWKNTANAHTLGDGWTYCRGTNRMIYAPGSPGYPLPFPTYRAAIIRQRPVISDI